MTEVDETSGGRPYQIAEAGRVGWPTSIAPPTPTSPRGGAEGLQRPIPRTGISERVRREPNGGGLQHPTWAESSTAERTRNRYIRWQIAGRNLKGSSARRRVETGQGGGVGVQVSDARAAALHRRGVIHALQAAQPDRRRAGNASHGLRHRPPGAYEMRGRVHMGTHSKSAAQARARGHAASDLYSIR